VFGDVYEYLLAYYTGDGGSAGGEFYTPPEVSELLAEIAVVGKDEVNNVYDPTCGSGSLLLKFAKVLGKDKVRQGFFGQEINITTHKLCVANMFLHGIECFDIAHGDTLTDPKHMGDEPFEVIVSNPPYSTKWEGDANQLRIRDPRFSPAGVLAPKSKADMAFVMHCVYHLAETGIAAIVVFPGILYRGGREQTIRRYLVDMGFVKTVIQLPNNMFVGTTISTCILVISKQKSENITFIDASSICTNVNKVNTFTDDNIDKIIDFIEEKVEVNGIMHIAPIDEVRSNDYNLSVSSYVNKVNSDEVVDIDELNKHIRQLRQSINKRSHELDEFIKSVTFDDTCVNDDDDSSEQQVIEF